MPQSWHVIKTISNREQIVSRYLKEQEIIAFCPMTIVTSVVRGQFKEKYQALFRNYTFAQWSTSDAESWHRVYDHPSVIGIIGEEQPKALAPGIIESWIKRAKDRDIIEDLSETVADLKRGYRVGSEVRLTKGREDSIKGRVVWVNDRRQLVGIRLDLLGRQPVVVRRQRDIESTSAPIAVEGNESRRKRRGGKRGARVRERAFAGYINSAIQAI